MGVQWTASPPCTVCVQHTWRNVGIGPCMSAITLKCVACGGGGLPHSHTTPGTHIGTQRYYKYIKTHQGDKNKTKPQA